MNVPIVLLAWLLLGAVLGWLLLRWLARRSHRTRGRHSLDLCLLLLQLVRDLQRHRGLSVATLDGNSEFGGQLATNEGALQQSFAALAEQYADSRALFNSPQWPTVLRHWRSLHGNWRELDFMTNLFAHNEVVLGLICLLQTQAQQQPSLLGARRLQIISQWPPMLEHLAMLRALGMHALSHADRSETARVGLALSGHRQQVKQTLCQLADKVPDKPLLSSSEALLRRAAALAQGEQQGDSPQRYYDDMTALIDRWYRLMNAQLLA